MPHDDSNEEDFHQRAAEHASRNAGGSGGADFFSGILGNFMGNKSQLANQEVDEERTSHPLLAAPYTHTEKKKREEKDRKGEEALTWSE